MGLPSSENNFFPVFLAVLVLCGGGCASSSATVLPGASGGDDYANQHRSTVQVYGRAHECSGVLIELHLVLTSAHCFCLPRGFESRAGSEVITPAHCERKAFVHLIRYVRQWDGQWRGIPESFEGTVLVHERFRARLEGGKVVSHEADLAVVEMEYSMWDVTADGNLPRAEVVPGERVIEVGFSSGEQGGGGESVRRFGGAVVKSVTSAREGTEVRFRTSGVPDFSSSSGGPCFRETAEGRWLVGIQSGLAEEGQEPWFTSTYAYRDWIEQQKKK